MRVVLGGTFDALHEGHERLIDKALEMGGSVILGLSTDAFAARRKHRACASFSERKRQLAAYLKRKGALGRTRIVELSDEHGIAAADATLDAIVVSSETESTAKRINKIRVKRGLKQLKIVAVPLAYAQDLKKISCERIRRGEIDERGRRLKPLVIAVGSTNPAKVTGVRAMAKRIFGNLRMRVKPVAVHSRISAQPLSWAETARGATERAVCAYESGADYGVGIEAGLQRIGERYYDAQFCAVFDGERATMGLSMGFEYPQHVLRRALRGSEIGSIIAELSGDEETKHKAGAIGFLSRGLLRRSEMAAQAFACAMIPRISASIYE
jgi:inosine/xanthosine triphosphatase